MLLRVNRVNRPLFIEIEGMKIETKKTMRYLGVILDNNLRFGQHLDHLENKVAAVSRALYRITPNLRGPRERRRRLYGNVILSVILYAAPIWREEISRSRRNRERMNGLMRSVDIRIIAGYRTVSLEAASVLARMPPVHLQAAMRQRMYLRIGDLKRNEQLTDQKVREIREEERLMMIRQWGVYLQRGGISGIRVRDAILPCLSEWLDRAHGSMEFHMTQVITGHGCFAAYLFRIQKVETEICEHCSLGRSDTADHTLQECPAWVDEREALKEVVGEDLSLGKVMQEIIKNEKSWSALLNYCRTVMRRKEDVEREKERQLSALTQIPHSSDEDSTES